MTYPIIVYRAFLLKESNEALKLSRPSSSLKGTEFNRKTKAIIQTLSQSKEIYYEPPPSTLSYVDTIDGRRITLMFVKMMHS